MEVHPTRLELLRLRRRKALADGIADILQKDLETLIISLIEFRQKAAAFKTQLHEKMNHAYSSYMEGEMIAGAITTRELSMSAQTQNLDVEVGAAKGVLGLPISIFHLTKQKDEGIATRLNILDTPFQLVEAASEIEEALNFIAKLAELMATIREILEMISLKRRQINRIRFKIIPQLDATIRYVELILEEIERQDAIRVRVLQRKRKERALKTA
ncbi:V-type ATP synthase subunit D [Candidatus Bathyarchaeota archaeon]|nr:V-type ATP synthase subunit D [Candidatus Bathyarchaeota archaeon]